MFPKRRSATLRTKDTSALRCSFCDKAQDEVRRLIAGPQIYICYECVAVCADMIAEESERQRNAELPPPDPQPRGAEDVPSLTIVCALCRMPTLAGDLLWIRERGMLCPGVHQRNRSGCCRGTGAETVSGGEGGRQRRTIKNTSMFPRYCYEA